MEAQELQTQSQETGENMGGRKGQRHFIPKGFLLSIWDCVQPAFRLDLRYFFSQVLQPYCPGTESLSPVSELFPAAVLCLRLLIPCRHMVQIMIQIPSGMSAILGTVQKGSENIFKFLLPTIQIRSCNCNFYWGSRSLRDSIGSPL